VSQAKGRSFLKGLNGVFHTVVLRFFDLPPVFNAKDRVFSDFFVFS
jgi:hypothetical protein